MRGIAVAGTLLVDKINEIAAYPHEGELTKIRRVRPAVGGCVPNVGIDLATLSPDLPVFAIGNVGKDEEAAFLRAELEARGIDCSGVVEVDDRTSFTEVMSVEGGQRTFFTYAGASASFGREDIDFSSFSAKMLHLGYFLLLDRVDAGDGKKILQDAVARGIKTSIDLVSENSDRYRSAVLPCLPYTDNLIINELEAGKLAGVEPNEENLPAIADALLSLGVRERVIIHMRECGVLATKNGFLKMPAIEPPKGFIQGKTGAGDAFCAGALLAIHEEMSDEAILSLASASAIASLSRPDAVSGMTDAVSLKNLVKDMKGTKLCW